MAESNRPTQSEVIQEGISERLHRQPILLLALGVILLCIGIILHFTDGHHKHPSLPYIYTFFREGGFACIIAYFLTMGIEKTSRDRHNALVQQQLHMIKENVFKAVYSTRQDVGIVKLLETEIFRRPFYRRGYEVIIVFKDIDANGERMLQVDTLCRYRIYNTTNKDQMFNFYATVEIPYDEKLAAEAKMTSLKINGIPLTKEQIIESNKKMPDTADFKRYLWPVNVPADGYADVEGEYTAVKYPRDALLWQVYDPCDGFKLTVFHPKDIIIFGDVIHSSPGSKRGGGPDEETFEIRISKPLFPNNGAQIWWSPQSEVAKKMNIDQLRT